MRIISQWGNRSGKGSADIRSVYFLHSLKRPAVWNGTEIYATFSRYFFTVFIHTGNFKMSDIFTKHVIDLCYGVFIFLIFDSYVKFLYAVSGDLTDSVRRRSLFNPIKRWTDIYIQLFWLIVLQCNAVKHLSRSTVICRVGIISRI